MTAGVTYIEERTYYPPGCDPDEVDADVFRVGVFYRGEGKYVVAGRGGRQAWEQLTSTGRWLWMPSRLTQMRWCRFDFEMACSLAEKAAAERTFRGMTWEQLVAAS